MKLVLTTDRLVGEVLANPIYTEYGVMFLNKGNKLTRSAISKLKKMGIITVYIEDGNDEISLQEILPTPIKLDVIARLAEIFEEVKKKEQVNHNKVSEIVTDIMDNISLSENATMISNLAPKDETVKLILHSLDVTLLSLMVGVSKRYDERKLLNLGVAAILHDIGKLFVEGQNHVRKGKEILKRNPSIPVTTYMAVFYMYEREDKSGLFGATGDNVHEYAKILGICNDYIKDIKGENPMLPHVAIEKITTDAVNKYDKEIYKYFLQSVYCYPNGLQVKLNNGQEGVVVMQNKGSTARPILAVKSEKGYEFCNLVQPDNLTLFIEEVIME
ncbi:HD domain-containing protein [Clostridium sp. YIM B02551]|uniref:HD-GYP domain-containing protein n=1 Tax=Clostridium sp. YIM B02551 TaxID=2910679 RepID=UPI001EEA0FB7|nr:HD domain-containing protein [Clostridium sp. YIM B02551]